MKRSLLVTFLVVLLLLCVSGLAMAATEYTDVKGLPEPVEKAIQQVTEDKLFEGYPDGSFRPTNGITRAQFATVVVRMSGLEDKVAAYAAKKSVFTDVSETHWAKGYLNVAYEYGLFKGRGNGIFDPEAKVTQSEVTVTLLRYAGFSDSQLGTYPADSNTLAKNLGLTAEISFVGKEVSTRANTAYMVSKVAAVHEAILGEKPSLYFYNGQAQPIFALDTVIKEVIYVETPVDTDKDGKLDLIQVFIKRPAATKNGLKVATIYQGLPYETGTTDAYDDDSYNDHAVDAKLQAQASTSTSAASYKYSSDLQQVTASGYSADHQASTAEAEAAAKSATAAAAWENTYSTGNYDYWLVRGYACVFSGGLGTRGSDGIATTGSEEETAAFAAVVDWLNGRAKAYLDAEGKIEVKADWSTGNVAMTGRSYGGSTAFAVASTGVKGLKTIIPLAGIANWYDYYRSQGTPAGAIYYPGDEASTLSYYTMSRMLDSKDYPTVKKVYEDYYQQMIIDEDRATGDYNAFWDERNYAQQSSKLDCSALIIHGLNDFNVKTKQFDLMYDAFKDSGNQVRLILHQGAHMTPSNIQGLDYYGILSKWLAYWLYGQNNGVLSELPAATVQSNVDLSWQKYTSWGDLRTSSTYRAGSGSASFSSSFKPTGFDPHLEWAEYFSDEMYAWEKAIATDATAASAGYKFPISQDLHISGTVTVTVRASLDKGSGILSAMLVDTAPGLQALQVNSREAIPLEDSGSQIWLSGDLGSTAQKQFAKQSSEYKIITRGWMDVQNRDSIYKVSSVTPGQYYTFTLELQPIDYTVQAGHTLSLVLYSADAQVTYWPVDVTTFTVDNSGTSMTIPTR